MQALATRVGDAETGISDVEDTKDVLQVKVTQLDKQITNTADHIDDLENHSRRCNLHLVGLPKGTKGKDAVTFMGTWLPSYLNLTTKTGKIKLDHAHRSQAPMPGTNQCARPIIMKLHNFADKQLVMAATWCLATEPNQPADWIRVSFFNDYSAAVAKKRKAFEELKSCLRRKNMDYALLYPATLKLSVNGKEKRFNTPDIALFLSNSTIIVGGDFNLMLNLLIDKFPHNTAPPSPQANMLHALCEGKGDRPACAKTLTTPQELEEGNPAGEKRPESPVGEGQAKAIQAPQS